MSALTVTGSVTLATGETRAVSGATEIRQQMLVGVDCDGNNFPAHLSLFPGAATVRIFRTPGAGLPPWTTAPMTQVPKSVIRHVSFRTPPTAELLNPWLDKVTEELWLTYWHEANRLPAGVPGPAQWRKDMVLLAGIIGEHPNGYHVKLVEVHAQYHAEHNQGLASTGNVQAYHSPSSDIIGWDAYNYPEHAASGILRDARQFLSMPLESGKLFERPWALNEFASTTVLGDTDGSRRAAWYTDVARMARDLGCAQIGLWCAQPAQPNLSYHIDDRPAERTAWQKVIKGEY